MAAEASGSDLIQVVALLAAGVVAVPIFKRMGLGSILGYLAAGVVIGPYILGPLYRLNNVESILQFGEFGVVLLLFVIGLELRPIRLWAMRSAIFGLGTAQLVATSLVLAAIGLALGLNFGQALFIKPLAGYKTRILGGLNCLTCSLDGTFGLFLGLVRFRPFQQSFSFMKSIAGILVSARPACDLNGIASFQQR